MYCSDEAPGSETLIVVQCTGGWVVSTWKNCFSASFGIMKHTPHEYHEYCRYQECKCNTVKYQVLQLLSNFLPLLIMLRTYRKLQVGGENGLE
jgi:hypothetical protein